MKSGYVSELLMVFEAFGNKWVEDTQQIYLVNVYTPFERT